MYVCICIFICLFVWISVLLRLLHIYIYTYRYRYGTSGHCRICSAAWLVTEVRVLSIVFTKKIHPYLKKAMELLGYRRSMHPVRGSAVWSNHPQKTARMPQRKRKHERDKRQAATSPNALVVIFLRAPGFLPILFTCLYDSCGLPASCFLDISQIWPTLPHIMTKPKVRGPGEMAARVV